MELEQLQDWHDLSTWRSGRYFGAHAFQRYLLSNLGGPILGKGKWFWRKHEIQEADSRSTIGPQLDPQS